MLKNLSLRKANNVFYLIYMPKYRENFVPERIMMTMIAILNALITRKILIETWLYDKQYNRDEVTPFSCWMR